MLKSAGIFLLSLFLFSQVYNTAVWVNYELNVQEITDEFCENTDKPELNCLGTCHLKKQIIQTDQSNSSEQPVAVYLNDIQLFNHTNDVDILIPTKNSPNHQTNIEVSYSYLTGLSVFHPPRA
jgi:hypothetical protein